MFSTEKAQKKVLKDLHLLKLIKFYFLNGGERGLKTDENVVNKIFLLKLGIGDS